MAFANGYALVIGTGTNEQGDRSQRFESTINDADWMAEVLTHPSLCAYPEDQVKVLRSSQATRESIEKELNDLKDRVWESDSPENCTVVVFFSGHGQRDRNKKSYLLPYGYKYEEGDDPATRAIDGKFLFERLDAIKGRVVLLLNACYSGGVMATLGGGDKDVVLGTEPLTEKQIEYLRKGKGFFILSAAQAAEEAYAYHTSLLQWKKKKYSPFTIGLSRGFAGKGKSGTDKFVRCLDLLTTCSAYVGFRTKMDQIPVGDIKGDNFAVGCYSPDKKDDFPLLGDDLKPNDDDDDNDEDPEDKRKRPLPSQVYYNYSGTFNSKGVMFYGSQNFRDNANISVTNFNTP
ncbi:hypothetical protein BC937DRAFT_92041 [Endogone sp. FLAS-F59071]|nr:hypothetical protein BC937DRAFT_92041 [Endogone sp. FLAS-F59071]|eukprot:RUS21630.1 hypothetical protein BC937DRAFT_92041 [Endogone sp. FLAS-F59071]